MTRRIAAAFSVAASPRAAASLLLVVGLLAAGCSPSRRETAPSLSATASSAMPAASGAAPASGGAPSAARAASARASDPRWIAARDEDPASQMRLAAAEGAAGLLDGVDDGGEVAATALLALPEAEDAEAALGRLGARALAAPPAQVGPLLTAILAIAGQPRRQREALDPEGARACGEAMLTLAARADLAREDRALAVSAARALAEKGCADARKIPGDLDPK